MEKQLVIFELANEYFGVDIGAVESIIKMQPITALPNAPYFIKGITNLRGKVLPVLDLRNRFGLAEVAATRDSRIIVIRIDETEVGMIVDGVSEVLSIPDTAIEAAPPIAVTINSTFIRGIAKLEERLIILLDLQMVLLIEEQDEMKDLPAIA